MGDALDLIYVDGRELIRASSNVDFNISGRGSVLSQVAPALRMLRAEAVFPGFSTEGRGALGNFLRLGIPAFQTRNKRSFFLDQSAILTFG